MNVTLCNMCMIENATNGRVLVQHRLPKPTNPWCGLTFPGGHVEAGEYGIEVGMSSRDIAGVATVALDGDGKALPLTEWSTFGEWSADPVGSKVVADVREAGERGELPKLPDNDMMRMFLGSMPINSMSTLMGESGKAISSFMLDGYAKLVG